MQLKEFIITEGKKKGYSLEKLSLKLGRSISSLRRTIDNGSLSCKDFERILEIFGSKSIIHYDKKNYEITLQ